MPLLHYLRKGDLEEEVAIALVDLGQPGQQSPVLVLQVLLGVLVLLAVVGRLPEAALLLVGVVADTGHETLEVLAQAHQLVLKSAWPFQ